MKKSAALLKKLMKDESGQGATEYILLLVVVVGLAMIFKTQITQAFSDKLKQLSDSIGSITSQ
jgi:Flp pilus assembly pilin Flp